MAAAVPASVDAISTVLSVSPITIAFSQLVTLYLLCRVRLFSSPLYTSAAPVVLAGTNC